MKIKNLLLSMLIIISGFLNGSSEKAFDWESMQTEIKKIKDSINTLTNASKPLLKISQSQVKINKIRNETQKKFFIYKEEKDTNKKQLITCIDIGQSLLLPKDLFLDEGDICKISVKSKDDPNNWNIEFLSKEENNSLCNTKEERITLRVFNDESNKSKWNLGTGVGFCGNNTAIIRGIPALGEGRYSPLYAIDIAITTEGLKFYADSGIKENELWGISEQKNWEIQTDETFMR